jgi:chromosome segregation ATPase
MHSLTNFQQKLQLLEQYLQVLLGRIQELQNEYSQTKEDISNSHFENHTLSNQVHQLQLELSKSRKENQILKNTNQRLENIHNNSSNFKKENQKLSNQIHQLRSKLSILQKENKKLQSRVNHSKNPNSEFVELTKNSIIIKMVIIISSLKILFFLSFKKTIFMNFSIILKNLFFKC